MTTEDRDIKALPEEKEDEVRQQNGAADGIGAIPRTKDIFGIVWLALCCIFMLTMLASGFNFFPLVGLVLSIVAAVALIARTAKDKPAGLFLWVSVLVIYGGTFLYFLIWGADSFGKRLWWNLVLLLGPVGMAVLFVFLRKFLNGKALKGVACAVLSLMIATTGIYVSPPSPPKRRARRRTSSSYSWTTWRMRTSRRTAISRAGLPPSTPPTSIPSRRTA